METLYLQHICSVSEAELKRLPLFQKRFLRVNKAHTEDVKTEVKIETAVAMQFFFNYLFTYLFTSAAISQSIPPRRKGSFHAGILLLFPSSSHRLRGAEWGHFLHVGSPQRWLSRRVGIPTRRWQGGEGGHAMLGPRTCSSEHLREGGLRLYTTVHAPIEGGGRAGSFCLGTLTLIQSSLFPLGRQCLSLDKGASKWDAFSWCPKYQWSISFKFEECSMFSGIYHFDFSSSFFFL